MTSKSRYGFVVGDRVEHVSGLAGVVTELSSGGVLVTWDGGAVNVCDPHDLRLQPPAPPADELAARREPVVDVDGDAEQWRTPFGSPKRWP